MIAVLHRRTLPGLVGLATFLALVLMCVAPIYPPLPAELTLELKFPSGNPARSEPLIASGVAGEGDFLVVNYLSRTTATFSHDAWSIGGPTSEVVTFQPGGRHTLRVTMPAFTALRGTPKSPTAPLRLVFDGREILRADVAFHPRAPARLFFGFNPVGGSTADGVFRGDIYDSAHRELHGGPSVHFPYTTRLALWFTQKPGELLVSVLLALAATHLLRRWFAPKIIQHPSKIINHLARPPHLTAVVVALLCALAFASVLTGGTFRLFFPDAFGNFYDYQALSFLEGRLDVPEAALGAEAFVFGGKVYGYFGPTPALLRVPFVFFDLGFGQLTRVAFLVYFLASLAAVYALLLHATRLFRGPTAIPSRSAVALLLTGAGLGTTLFFLSSRAYIYHEAILCGVACALWSAWFSLRWLADSTTRAWLPALLLGTLAVHSRPPVGLFALTLLGCVAAAHVLRAWFAPKIEHHQSSIIKFLAIGLLSLLAVFSFNALSYLKFQSFEGAPLKYHVQYHPERLAAIDGRNFHVSNFRYNFAGYIWRPNYVIQATFPYFFITGRNPNEYPGSKIDLAEPTLALPYAMPAIVLLAVVGGWVAVARRSASRLPLALLALAVLPMSAALFTAIAISQRYTADFCPALLVAAAFGLAAVSLFQPFLRRAVLVFVGCLTLVSAYVSLSSALYYQGELVWGVPDDVKARYQSLRQSADALFGLTPHDR